jgi:hypothetical protein
MKNKQIKIISNLLFCISLFLTFPSFGQDKSKDKLMMESCERYILNYKPLYINGKDTFLVARFNVVPDSLNSFLIQCAKENNFQPLQYSYALILRHNAECISINHEDYLIGDLVISENGFIILLLKAMNFEKIVDDFSLIAYLPIYTGDVCKWFEKNQKTIVNSHFIYKYKKWIALQISRENQKKSEP